MASQEGSGIALAHAPDRVGYKLLELPPELQSILEAADAPILTLESSPTAALLKTPTKTYSLRQKNTSNALMLLAPTTSAPSHTDIPVDDLKIIATVHETIELIEEIEPGPQSSRLHNTGSKGKWHERFGRGR